MTSPTWIESCAISNAYQTMFYARYHENDMAMFFWRAASKSALPYSIVGRLQGCLLPNSSRRSIVIVMSFEKLHPRVGRSRIFPTVIRAIGAGQPS